jgi:hypothetical protein
MAVKRISGILPSFARVVPYTLAPPVGGYKLMLNRRRCHDSSRSIGKNTRMPSQLPSPWGLTAKQFHELEHWCRTLASKATNAQSVNLLLALSDRFKARARERNSEPGQAREPDSKSSK